jgi:septum site-determining protein MinC
VCPGDPVSSLSKALNKKADHAAREPACEIRFGQVGLAQLRVRTTDASVIHEDLAARLTAAPQLFERTAVCLDLGALEKAPEVSDIRALLDAVRRAGMLPVGLASDGTETIAGLASQVNLPVLTQFRAQNKLTRPAAAQPATASASAAATADLQAFATSALMHHQPVRSGQRIYARNRDLVVTTVVGAGAEVMADGCVHVYGALRGRAMAGARGEVTARVFCQEFRAELVSIAGVFRVFETIPPELAGKPVQAWLDGDDLRFTRIGA